jgi:hypothetical protein
MVFRSKKGSLLDLYNVFITLFFCGVVIGASLYSSSLPDVSFISPVSVLEVGDLRYHFELEERFLLEKTYCDSLTADSRELKDTFCSTLSSSDFLTRNTFFLEGTLSSSTSLCDDLYSFSLDSGELRVSREGLYKRVPLDYDKKKVHFPMKLEYELKKEYLLTKENCK